MVTIIKNGTTYRLNKEELCNYILALKKRADILKAKKQAQIDIEKEYKKD